MTRRILVVEVNPINQKIFQYMLNMQGYECDLVSTAAEALTAIDTTKSTRYALVVMELRLPDQDGFSTARIIRESGHRVPIIAVTANLEEEDKRRALDAGINGYLGKNFSFSDLSDVLKRWLKVDQGERIKDSVT